MPHRHGRNRMTDFYPARLTVTYHNPAKNDSSLDPRKYTLTHSDTTGQLFLTIGKSFNHRKLKHWYTRFMRDEVLGEWKDRNGEPVLAVYCHVNGGVVFGWASLRYRIFCQELPLALKAILYGDRPLFQSRPGLENSRIEVHFHATRKRYNLVEEWGSCGQYLVLS